LFLLLRVLHIGSFMLHASDFNAPLVADGQLVKNSFGSPNLNSTLLSTFIQARDLTAANGLLRQRHRKLATFHGPNKRITRLDWIFCPSSLRTRLRRVVTVRPACVRSDHSLVICETDLHWQRRKKPPLSPLWSALSDNVLRKAYLDKLRAADLGESAHAFSKAAIAAASILPTKRLDRPKALWLSDPAIEQARRQVQSASALHGFDSSQALAAAAHLDAVYSHQAEQQIEEEVRTIQLATDNCRHSAAWKAINRLTGRKARPTAVIGADSKEHRKALLAAHYSRVLNASPPLVDPPPIEGFCAADPSAFYTGPIIVDEVIRAVRSMRADATPGVDGIPPRVLKLPELAPALTSVLNKHCCLGGDAAANAPPPWRTSVIVSIPKSGGSTRLENQRGIALECSTPKVLNAVLRNRLLPGLSPLLLGLQSGFRPGRSAVEQIATIRSLIDACRTRQRAISIVFVDFRKAFDSVSRSAIRWLLSAYGVPSPLVNAIMDLYSETKAFVQTRDGPTGEFNTI
jgi:hypothetical protein